MKVQIIALSVVLALVNVGAHAQQRNMAPFGDQPALTPSGLPAGSLRYEIVCAGKMPFVVFYLLGSGSARAHGYVPYTTPPGVPNPCDNVGK